MDRQCAEESESRFAVFVERLSDVIGHRDRAGPLRDYYAGLLAGGERQSGQPLAGITAPARVYGQNQSPLHLAGQPPWSDEAGLRKIAEMTLTLIERRRPD